MACCSWCFCLAHTHTRRIPGTNYCNLHNLAEKTGLTFNEDIDTSDCTQYQTANCNKY